MGEAGDDGEEGKKEKEKKKKKRKPAHNKFKQPFNKQDIIKTGKPPNKTTKASDVKGLETPDILNVIQVIQYFVVVVVVIVIIIIIIIVIIIIIYSYQPFFQFR